VVSTTGKPFELLVKTTVENLAPDARRHRFTIEQTAWRTEAETKGGFLSPISENMTTTLVAAAKVEKQTPGDFEPGDFKDEHFTAEKWRRSPGEARFVATNSSYFSSAVVPLSGPARPYAESQIEEIWRAGQFAKKSDDPEHGHLYRTRLAYPDQELAPGASVTYEDLAYMGPKERDVLAHVGNGQHGVSDVIDLGWFGVIGKVLISYVYWLQRTTGSWGWAIVLLTISVKTLLFPLSITQIKSSVAMRRLKPEMDEINEKYKDDMQQRGLATQELFRKHGMSQFSTLTGCIPVMLQMPVWFALYTALQTAVELYHTPFGPVIPDLSQPGRYFIIPAVLGMSSFFQQRLMPPQGDPAQQKMMKYMMPGIFTVMMLFLPAGLGVYMLTNTWLGIAQQVLVERYLKSKVAKTPPGDIKVREKKDSTGDSDKSARSALESSPALGKGKARVRG
jgi:YidC/Oxa1 family membrane protein insertase